MFGRYNHQPKSPKTIEEIVRRYHGENYPIPNLESVKRTLGEVAWLEHTRHVVTGSASLVLRNDDCEAFPMRANDVDILVPFASFYQFWAHEQTPDGERIFNIGDEFPSHIQLRYSENNLPIDIIPWKRLDGNEVSPDLSEFEHRDQHAIIGLESLRARIKQTSRTDHVKRNNDNYKLALIDYHLAQG